MEWIDGASERGVLRLTLMLADGVFKVDSLGVEGGSGGNAREDSEVKETGGDLLGISDCMGEKGVESWIEIVRICI